MNSWGFREGMGALCPSPTPCPQHLFHLAVPELQPFIINQQSSKKKKSNLMQESTLRLLPQLWLSEEKSHLHTRDFVMTAKERADLVFHPRH